MNPNSSLDFPNDGREFCARCGHPTEHSSTLYGLECDLCGHLKQYTFDGGEGEGTPPE